MIDRKELRHLCRRNPSLTLKELGQHFGVSGQRINQVMAQMGLHKTKTWMWVYKPSLICPLCGDEKGPGMLFCQKCRGLVRQKSSVDTIYIYALRDPETGMIRYVGGSGNPIRRLYNHLIEAMGVYKNARTRWIDALQRKGLTPRIEVIESIPVDEWKERERAWIKAMRAEGYDLTNG